MKRLFLFCTLFVFFLPLCTSCSDDKDEDRTEITELLVSDKTTDYRPIESPNIVKPLLGIQVREPSSKYWLVIPINGIVGFEYEEGYFYRLKVEERHLSNPPLDAMNVEFKLIKVLSKERMHQ